MDQPNGQRSAAHARRGFWGFVQRLFLVLRRCALFLGHDAHADLKVFDRQPQGECACASVARLLFCAHIRRAGSSRRLRRASCLSRLLSMGSARCRVWRNVGGMFYPDEHPAVDGLRREAACMLLILSRAAGLWHLGDADIQATLKSGRHFDRRRRQFLPRSSFSIISSFLVGL
ncbi:hypothetical protein DENSPDRAFT_222482 [Dentipellis sp. KUC8613]|nr:hypothetical protein DENSPDRAFT_222482 [Dentipellis sp. KUC8613]